MLCSRPFGLYSLEMHPLQNSQQLPLGREGGNCASLLGLPVIMIRRNTNKITAWRKEREGRKEETETREAENRKTTCLALGNSSNKKTIILIIKKTANMHKMSFTELKKIHVPIRRQHTWTKWLQAQTVQNTPVRSQGRGQGELNVQLRKRPPPQPSTANCICEAPLQLCAS